MSASNTRFVLQGVFIILVLASPLARGASGTAAIASPVLNIRDFGALGDGRLHRVKEWIDQGRFSNLRRIQEAFPFVDNLDWSIDEIAFEQAKSALPATGGTIHFPVGHYVTGRHPWRIWRDHIRITGDGPERTILSTAPEIEDGLSVAPYRHVGWLEGAHREYPYTASSGARGSESIELKLPEWTKDFSPGDLVFIRNGANRFDQDYGEFNEVARVGGDGLVYLKYALGRDYTLSRFNWAGEIATDFAMPAPNGTVRIKLSSGEGRFVPGERATISVGDNLFRVDKVYPVKKGAPRELRLLNPGRGNAARGTRIAADTKIGKSRTVIKLTRSVRNFRCENLQVVGRRKTLVISNTYNTAFTDCVLVRDVRDGGVKGGLTIDGDGGRFARFERCRIVGLPAAGMQFARSFAGVVFAGCSFLDANAAFTEFNFDCEVTRCSFNITGTPQLKNVIIAGKSCGDLRFIDNQIRAAGVDVIFDTHSDIQSQKHGSEGEFVVRGNVIETKNVPQLYTVPRFDRFIIGENSVTHR